MTSAINPNVLLVGGSLHGARIRVERLPVTMVLAQPGANTKTPRALYVHQYEVIEKDNAAHKHLVSVYAAVGLPHPEVLRLAKLAARTSAWNTK